MLIWWETEIYGSLSFLTWFFCTHCSPMLDLDPIALIADGIAPFRTLILISASFGWCFTFLLPYLPFNDVALNFCRHALLFLSCWFGGRLKFTVLCRFSHDFFVMWQMHSAVRYGSSTFLVSGAQNLCRWVYGELIFILFQLTHSVTSASLMSDPVSSYLTLYHDSRLYLFFSNLNHPISRW